MYDYYQLNNIIGSAVVPSAVHPLHNQTASFFFRYLLEKAAEIKRRTGGVSK